MTDKSGKSDKSDPMLMLILAIFGLCALAIIGYGVQEISESIFSPDSNQEQVR